ncbi:MAG: hypothetical protein IJU61_09760 [Victivallales bacterium]|nr:hypothetical protein [Victivallales bacterium]
MTYYRYGAYILSDDFDRFHHLVVGNGMHIIYTSSREKGRFVTATPSNVDSQRFALFRRFNAEKWMFIDPLTQHNPETEAVVRKTSMVKWGDPLIPDMTAFARIRGMLQEATANYRRPIY